MALLHFYDPKNPERPYLTDQQFLVRLIRFLGGTTFDNPQWDAVTWTFRTRPEDTIEFLGLFDQEYGWIQAKEYLKKAIESKNPGDFYGKAWRAVGEVMHMVADMTVPAHVRNDGHAAVLGDSDPYERGTPATTSMRPWREGVRRISSIFALTPKPSCGMSPPTPTPTFSPRTPSPNGMSHCP
jgi:hypothetical protein